MAEKSKETASSIGRVNLGIFLIFIQLFLFAANSNYFSSYLVQYSLSLIVEFILFGYFIVSGLRKFSRQKVRFKIAGKPVFKYIELVPNVSGFIFLGVGVYLVSFFKIQKVGLASGATQEFVVHQYSTAAGTLYLLGTATILLTFLIYNYLLPKQIEELPVKS